MSATLENPTVPPAPVRQPLRIVVRRSRSDRAYRAVAWAAGLTTFVILVLIGFFLFWNSRLAFQVMGVWRFLTTTAWVPNGAHPHFGVEAALVGTVIIAAIAVVIAFPVSMCCALFINEYAPRKLVGFIPLKGFLTSVVDLMAAVPSVIYGLWGFFVLQADQQGIARFFTDHFGWIPFFKTSSGIYTSSFFIAGTLVGIMIMPILTALSREVFSLTPIAEREGALALGASRARVIRDVVFPFAKGGVIGAVMLGLGRALGEAIAVTFIISAVYTLQPDILQAGGNSIAALIALRFGTGGEVGLAGLMAAGLVLFVFTLIINLLASWIVNRSRAQRA